MNEHSNTIKTRSCVGTLVEGLENPNRPFRTSMKATPTDFARLEMDEAEADALVLAEAEAKIEEEKQALLSLDSLEEKLSYYNACMTIEIILKILTDDEAVTSKKKDVIIKAWKKTKKKMENTSTKIQKF